MKSAILQRILGNFNTLGDNIALVARDKKTTYAELADMVLGIRNIILETAPKDERIGVLTLDDAQTYAALLACWYSGKAYVPINPGNPPERNELVIKKAGLKTVLGTKEEIFSESNDLQFIPTEKIKSTYSEEELSADRDPESLAYILFTSGSTGIPKGVPIRFTNLDAFIEAFFALGYNIGPEDRVLQMFDLTFDLSLMSYVAPLVAGASFYPLNPDMIKYMAIYDVLEEQEITVALMVPSILSYLRPYFRDIDLEKMRYSLFCGEALYKDIASEWQQCVPNALVQNVYGPTEATIFCTTYNCTGYKKEHNGILSIGKAMQNMDTAIVDEEDKPVSKGKIGELVLSGAQLTEGYWDDPLKNADAFFSMNNNGHKKTWYRSGDLCFEDNEGDLMFAGRRDSQVKIQGFRVELSEIEHFAREHCDISHVVAVARNKEDGTPELVLFLENWKGDTAKLKEHLKVHLPVYMIPSEYIIKESFPLNVNGKVDRKTLRNEY